MEEANASAREEIMRLARRVADLQRDRARLERFAAYAAHEVLLPLVMSEAFCHSILQREGHKLADESRAELERLSASAMRTRTAVDALLRSARYAGRPPARVSVDLRALVDEVADGLREEFELRVARLIVKPLPVIAGDRGLLGVLLKNLLLNALRHGPPRNGVIRVSASRVGGGWRIGVTSGGRPLGADEVGRIFTPFERGSGERPVDGAGLGLAICREVVERHGGAIGVHPLRAGNRFHFTLPE